MFPDVGIVREVQHELDSVIEEGVINIVNLLKNQVRVINSQPAQESGESYQHYHLSQKSGENYQHCQPA